MEARMAGATFDPGPVDPKPASFDSHTHPGPIDALELLPPRGGERLLYIRETADQIHRGRPSIEERRAAREAVIRAKARDAKLVGARSLGHFNLAPSDPRVIEN